MHILYHTALSTSASSKVRPLHVHLFRQMDLRLHDNPSLCASIDAAQKSAAATGIVPVFCFDPRIFGNEALSEFGNLKCGPRRARFEGCCAVDSPWLNFSTT